MSDVTDEAKKRIADYLDRRARANGFDKEEIHTFDAGCNGQTVLLTGDLTALLAENATLNGEIQALLDEADMAEQEAGAIENDLIEAEKEIAAKDAALASINDKAIMNAGEFARFVRDTIAALKGDTHE